MPSDSCLSTHNQNILNNKHYLLSPLNTLPFRFQEVGSILPQFPSKIHETLKKTRQHEIVVFKAVQALTEKKSLISPLFTKVNITSCGNLRKTQGNKYKSSTTLNNIQR